jgi:hypothetical protein
MFMLVAFLRALGVRRGESFPAEHRAFGVLRGESLFRFEAGDRAKQMHLTAKFAKSAKRRRDVNGNVSPIKDSIKHMVTKI